MDELESLEDLVGSGTLGGVKVEHRGAIQGFPMIKYQKTNDDSNRRLMLIKGGWII